MSTESNELAEKKDHSFRWFIGSIFIVIAIWLFNAYVYPLINDSLASRASNGDMFGPTNALFSGLAFAGLIYTIVMQRKELEMQRMELRLQREAIADSTKEQAKQACAQEEHLTEIKIQNVLLIAQSQAMQSQLKMEYFKLKCELETNKHMKQAALIEIKQCSDNYDKVLRSVNDSVKQYMKK